MLGTFRSQSVNFVVYYKSMKHFLKHIEIDPTVMVGKPVVRGTRIPVHLILNLLAQGYDTKRILMAYPTLKAEDITAVLQFAATRLAREETYTNA